VDLRMAAVRHPHAVLPPVGDGPLIVRAKLALGRLHLETGFISAVVALGSTGACVGCDRPIPASESEVRARRPARRISDCADYCHKNTSP
jgi:hypothetical protein